MRFFWCVDNFCWQTGKRLRNMGLSKLGKLCYSVGQKWLLWYLKLVQVLVDGHRRWEQLLTRRVRLFLVRLVLDAPPGFGGLLHLNRSSGDVIRDGSRIEGLQISMSRTRPVLVVILGLGRIFRNRRVFRAARGGRRRLPRLVLVGVRRSGCQNFSPLLRVESTHCSDFISFLGFLFIFQIFWSFFKFWLLNVYVFPHKFSRKTFWRFEQCPSYISSS